MNCSGLRSYSQSIRRVAIGLSHGLRLVLALSFTISLISTASAQEATHLNIQIGGNVYGGGNEGNVEGSTTVTVRGGTIKNVFGGARMADVEKRSFVNIDGEHASSDIFITNVYGGNDISGTVGKNINLKSVALDSVPAALTDVLREGETAANYPHKNAINNSWSTFVRTSRSSKTENGVTKEDKAVIIGSLFGGGNGDYDYASTTNSETGKTTHYIYERSDTNHEHPIATKETVTGEAGFTSPTLAKTYLELKGGCIAHAYGGGNNATVTENTTICINNESDDLLAIAQQYAAATAGTPQEMTVQQLFAYLQTMVDLSTFQADLSSISYTFARVFGGNNKVAMAIQPKWNLRKGSIRDLYSGGNEGEMNNSFGLLLDIPEDSEIKVNNVYGGCRRADVRPRENGTGNYLSNAALKYIQLPADMGYKFPMGYSARTIVRGGDVNNVYGGNDISGNVYGGSAVGVYTSIRGDVYGGGNGSYSYTDNVNFKDNPLFNDYYYDVAAILANEGMTPGESASLNSAKALKMHRPNAERISLRLWGKDAAHPTIIGGSVYVGGNCATLKDRGQDVTAEGEVKIGSHVYANNVFLGNNGEHMVDESLMQLYAGYLDPSGNVVTSGEYATAAYEFSKMDLTDSNTFAEYMKGCASFIRPKVVFDKKNDDGTGDPDTYQDFTSYFGSFFCGGNIGSTMWPGTAELNFNRKVIIFKNLVAGCNNADVPSSTLHAAFNGGVLGSEEELEAFDTWEQNNEIQDAIHLNLSGFKIQPKRWVIKRNPSTYAPILTDGKVTYLAQTCGCELSAINDVCTTHGNHAYLEWNTIKRTGEDDAPVTSGQTSTTTRADLDRRFQYGNIYGGCYTSGRVVGNVVINMNETVMDEDVLFDRVQQDELGEAVLYDDVLNPDDQSLTILERRTGVLLDRQGMDVLGKALNVFGGGFGKDTEIWGSTTVNLNAGYVFQIFGGSEKGVIGRSTGSTNAADGTYNSATETYAFNGKTYKKNDNYSCTVNVRGTVAGVSKQDDSSEAMSRAEFIYGGGFMGPICGNTRINLGNGRVFNTFAGSCMADILGHTETYMGRQVNEQSEETGEGFPYVRDYIYCGNDLGGRILGSKDFIGRVRDAETADFDNDATTTDDNPKSIIQATTSHTANVTNASAYVEYRQGRAEGIFGGCFGTYDYTDPYYGEYFYATGDSVINATHPAGSARTGYTKPRMGNAFVNFRPNSTPELMANKYNFVNTIYGAGQGYPGDGDRDIMQKSSYVLIDIPQEMTNFLNMEVFGAGAWSGLGMDYPLTNKTAAEIAALSDGAKAAYADSLDVHSATIDLVRGQVGAAYGGSYSEGITRRTMVNVPQHSTIRIGSIFGGAYGTETFMPCDVYEGNVEYHSADAAMVYNALRQDENGNTIGNKLYNGAIYGGNNDKRRTLFAKVTIDARVNQVHPVYGMTRANVFGAGLGGSTWAEYTEVNLNDGAEVYEVYGGGQAGKVFCAEAVTAYKAMPRSTYLPVQDGVVVWPEGTYKAGEAFTEADFENAWRIGGGYDPGDEDNNGVTDEYWQATATNLKNPLARRAEIDDRDWSELTAADLALIDHKYNINVIINKGAYVANYAYGAGLGEEALVGGHVYIALLGGEVKKDLYAGGTSGPVEDTFGAGNYGSHNTAGFEATTTAYIEGGTVRNVYGGGWRGNVGHHAGTINESTKNDILGESHVIIGKIGGTDHIDGIPSVTRNVYGGGEGGSIWGTAFVKINNGYIGYRFTALASGAKIDKGATYYTLSGGAYTPHTADADITVDANTANSYYQYKEELDDAKPGDNQLDKGGNVFGGGYVANSYVDHSEVEMYGGTIRGCLFGGGEIGPIGRGTVNSDTLALGRSYNIPRSASDNTPIAAIYKPGKAHVTMYGGHVLRDVFGGGRGYDNWNGDGWMSEDERATLDLSSKGYIFGRTQVFIRGGEIGTEEGVAVGFGNVFGGCDRGFVYSGYGEQKEYFTQAEIDAASAEDPAYGKTIYDVKSATPLVGRKSGARYDGVDEGYYYKYDGTGFVMSGSEKLLTEDCKVVIGPQCQVKPGQTVTLTNVFYPKKAPIPPVDLAYLKENDLNGGDYDADGIVTADNGITIASRTYLAGDYVPTYALQAMGKKNVDTRWDDLDDAGVIIHNAVFAGGNVSSGDDQVYANAPTVFGNATASVHDLYHRDLVTIGTGHVGGLYGEGNLTLVDGYRGLNITNYGTDYYNLNMDIDYATYLALPDREKAYYELRYKCVQQCTDNQGKTYHPEQGTTAASVITSTDLFVLFEQKEGTNTTNVFNEDGSVNSAYWVQNGVCSLYAGRIMNTVQRADFCGVFGSRLVLQGAPDRVPEVIDYTNYTINRVREVSLNKKESIIPADANDPEDKEHGNYFGIYSIVNHLGALTSDVDLTDVRVTGNSKYPSHSTNETYIDYKSYGYLNSSVSDKRNRNRGSSHNKVALASGVYLELTTEKGTGNGVNEKDWGYITGVIELDLINVQTGIGGGYVYAKNVHGVRSNTNKTQTTLTALNTGAVTRKRYSYSDDTNVDASNIVEWETSGNFVHDEQTIIDDCYDVSNSYKGTGRSPAHFWYIKGQVYIYEQYISAYTGAPAAYKETVNIPLTITAASHGKLKLLNIQPNHYAYYKNYSSASSNTVLGSGDMLELNNLTYQLNDPIDYWAYSQLTPAEQALFVPETYTTIAECKIGNATYPAGTVLLPTGVSSLRTNAPTDVVANVENVPVGTTATSVPYVTQETTDGQGNTTTKKVAFDFVFRPTNNISHTTGYILTYDVNNPMKWNDWYTPKVGAASAKIDTDSYGALTSGQDDYYDGPTYRVKDGKAGVYGQYSYVVSDIIDQSVYGTYQTMYNSHKNDNPSTIPAGQAQFETAYLVTADVLESKDKNDKDIRLYKGSALAKENFTTAQWDAMTGSVDSAYVSTATIQVSNTEYIYTGDLMTPTRRTELINAAPNDSELKTLIKNSIVKAYYCTEKGLYGGNYYATGNNYRGLEAWCSMSATDRENFTFNYDALDVLIDPLYSRNANGAEIYATGKKYQYDGEGFTTAAQALTNPAAYSLERALDYTATYNSTTNLEVTNAVTVKHTDGSSENVTRIVKGDVLRNDAYESLPNEQYHYAPITVSAAGETVYVVNEDFVKGDTPYAVGQTLTESEYNALGSDQSYVKELTGLAVGTYYYCRDSYVVGEHGRGQAVVDITDNNRSYENGATVPVGVVIAQGDENTGGTYLHLVNLQKNFIIQGTAPVETSTLYVARNSDIYDLSEEKIITVIYQYDYEESDDTGLHIVPVSERHVVNIHLQFKSGIPAVTNITEPDIVLPGTNVVIQTPTVTPGAYEVIGGGWEIYRDDTDAENHTNGLPYSPALDPLYWYQNGYYVAYYAKTYLGKTYSNYVPVSVANYHDLKKVMDDKVNHYYVDNKDVKRDPKIYINDYTTDDPSTSQNGLTLLKNFFDLTLQAPTYYPAGHEHEGEVKPFSSDVLDGALEGHYPVNRTTIGGAKNLEFILRTDLAAPSDWAGIGNSSNNQCFEGIFHGDGHTITGLDHSLFNNLCGDVYNLGVTGTFTTAGLADNGTGYLENCWVKSDNNNDKTAKPVFDNPTNTSGTNPRTVHMVNCYYPEENKYTDHDENVTYGKPTEKPLQAFYNGEVTYDLNEFYLFKRYCDNTASITGNDYYYWKDVNGTLVKQTGHYPSNADGPYLMNDDKGNYVGSYVESRFADGDFVYAAGSIPGSRDKRFLTYTVTSNNQETEKSTYSPIWPDDYLYFGQMLTYGYVDARAHQALPAPINKNGDRLPNAATVALSNRVYRAPAYYQSLTMGAAYFNPNVVLAQTKNGDASLLVHKNMTALDFTGGNGDLASGYQKGWQSAVAPTIESPAKPGGLPERFYPPLLDDEGIFSIRNVNLSRNLLVYTGSASGTPTAAQQQTDGVVGAYLLDQAYAESNATYRTVAVWDSHSDNVLGHWVQGSGGSYIAPRDNLLVDKQDFNAPISYQLANGKRMWYQRTPDTFVDRKKGWEGVSLPFAAEIVTTQTKGELTHFYQGSTTGHEYWLRAFEGMQKEGGNLVNAKDDQGNAIANVYLGTFNPMAAGSNTKEYTNTFLWDYYYKYSSVPRQDKNDDEYQQGYYNTSHTYSNYPYSAAGTPYIIGFPGNTYYEFDLSGTFIAANTNTNQEVAQLAKQTVTFASKPSSQGSPTTIAVSDTEIAAGSVTSDGYTFTPNYLGKTLSYSTTAGDLAYYVLKADGSSYEQQTAGVQSVPFRPYFTTTIPSTSRRETRARGIAFGYDTGIDNSELMPHEGDLNEGLRIYARRGKIVVESYRQTEGSVRILNASGLTVNTFTIQPGETIETRIHATGVYIANGKKLRVEGR